MFGNLGSFSVGQVLGLVVLLAQRHWERPKQVGRGTHVLQSCKITLESQPTVPLYISENVRYHKLYYTTSHFYKVFFLKEFVRWFLLVTLVDVSCPR